MKRTVYRNITFFILIVALSVALTLTLVVYLTYISFGGKNQGETFIVKVLTVAFLTPIAGATLVTYILRKKIALAIGLLREEIDRIRSIKDLSKMKFKDIDLNFEELNEIRRGLIALVDRLNSVAVDRDIFEMELRLIQGLVLTSDVVRDWKKTTKSILSKVDKVSNFLCTFFVFSDKRKSVCYIFWNTERNPDIENRIKELVDENPDFEHLYLRLRPVKEHSGNLVLRTRRLRKPSVGGVVRAGMVLTDIFTREELKVIDNFLVLLAQVVGAVKALDEFTDKLEYYAARDPLTKLYNQRVFWEFLEYEINRARRHGYRFALLVIDIDNFKVINDTYGHGFGDTVLKEVAKTLRESLREGDIIARYGGDEFTVILPYSSHDQAFRVANRIVEKLSKLSITSPDGKKLRLTVSVGIAVFPDHAEDSKRLFTIADNMMYKAKEEGKNRIILPTDRDMERVIGEFGKKGTLIVEAVEKRRVFPVFQPIADVRTLETYAYEVLMRIEGDDRVLKAEEFITVAENMGLVHRLDYIVLEKALGKLSTSNFKGKLFFNLSPRSLVLKDFTDNLIRIVRESGVDPERVVFEITERETVKNIELLKDFIRRLRDEGFSFAIDDFGSGFSSFMYLKHFPVDYIKIEGEFIRSLISSKMDMAFVISITAMCKHLNIKTIAEFVENEEVFNEVKALGVDYVQGFYIGKPVRKP